MRQASENPTGFSDESATGWVSPALRAPPNSRTRKRKSELPLEVHRTQELPSFEGKMRTRIGSSLIIGFVRGHEASDVLRELVQNEYDGGGNSLSLAFGEDALFVAGNGKGISRDGWERLSVIIGTGAVVGDGNNDHVAPKTNGIGSKNFGLRSLFLFGDQIYVSSRGRICKLDLPTLQSGIEAVRGGTGERGVRLFVPYRTIAFETLVPFTVEEETIAFDAMADRALATLVKLAHSGARQGIRSLDLRSERTQRTLTWKQKADKVSAKIRGVHALRRTGTLVRTEQGVESKSRFEEIEFSKLLDIPAKWRNREFPSYYGAGEGRLRLALSLPLLKQKIDLTRGGHCYYPLEAPSALTGCVASASAPFELNNDRSGLLPGDEWNDWLIKEAAAFAVELVKGDWFRRFGADAYKALRRSDSGSSGRFVDEVHKLLAKMDCWPSVSRDGIHWLAANELAIADEPLFYGLFSEARYLHLDLTKDAILREMAMAAGARRFTLNSLVRVRCAGQVAKGLQTTLRDDETSFSLRDYTSALSRPEIQKSMATILTTLRRRLSNQNRHDLRDTPSTLTAALSLRPARELILVPENIWDACPELENRLHPFLNSERAISVYCTEFDEDKWLTQAAGRALDGTISDAERNAVYEKLISDSGSIGRRAMAALRGAPIVKNSRDEWDAPENMVLLSGSHTKLLAPVISTPAKAVLQSKELMARLGLRNRLTANDLIACAETIEQRPEFAERFEKLLLDNMRLLSRHVIDELDDIPFLRSKSGDLAEPQNLYLDTPLNRLCIDDPTLIVAGPNEILYRKLGVTEQPSVDAILDTIRRAKDDERAPPKPDVLYPALVDALKRDNQAKDALESEEILWVDDDYFAPEFVVVSTTAHRMFDEVVPVLRRSDGLALAYVSLGASRQIEEVHWYSLFEHIADEWDGEPVDNQTRRTLLQAYQLRGAYGLPPGLESADCLLANNGLLYSPNELRSGLLVENDYPDLAHALKASDAPIGIIDLNDRTRGLYMQLGIRPLSTIAGSGEAEFGATANKPGWFRPKAIERTMALFSSPLFARAIFDLALRQRHAGGPQHLANLDELSARLAALNSIQFFDSIHRRHKIAGQNVAVPVEAAARGGVVGLVTPRTMLDFNQLLTQVVAELVGAQNVAQVRALSNSFLPLFLCSAQADIVAYLSRMGIRAVSSKDDPEPELAFPDEDGIDGDGDLSSAISDQLIGSLNTQSGSVESEPPPARAETVAPATSPAPQPPSLPPLDEVTLTVESVSNKEVSAAKSRGSSSGGSSSWVPRTVAEIERDQLMGERGEELVYRMELQRVRGFGHAEPEKLVTWTSRNNLGADHDIRSVDEHGNVRWLEVKSTTGVDGRFEWSRKEFEKALRERHQYELWRVYRVGSTEPVAKCFPDPAELLSCSRIQLELGTIRAVIEDL